MNKLIPWLQLCRLAAVFTAMADIFVGYLLTRPDLESSHAFVWLLAASSGLYLAGMVLNDVFDRHVDARERPNRPIPSGRVSLFGAITLGVLLLAGGFTAACLAGVPSAIVAGLLIGAILLYDGVLKNTPLGPVVMGSCRFLNILLGASTAIDPETLERSLSAVFRGPQIAVALGLGTYIAGTTWFARREAEVSSRAHLVGAVAVINLGLMLLAAFAMHYPDPEMALRSWNTVLMLAAIGVVINRRILKALLDPVPLRVQAGVRTLLMSLVMLDATLVFFANENRLYAIGVAALLIPAQFLGRYLAVT